MPLKAGRQPARIYKGGESVKGLGAATEPTTTGDQHSRAE
jgi:hypothetical protein